MINDDIFQLEISHQIGLRRLESTEVKSLLAFYVAQRREINSRLYSRWGKKSNARITKLKLNELRKFANKQINLLSKKVQSKIYKSVVQSSSYEMNFQKNLYEKVLKKNVRKTLGQSVSNQVQFNFSIPTQAKIKSAIEVTPFKGGLPKEWFKNFNQAQKTHITRSLRSSVFQGESVSGLSRRLKPAMNTSTNQLNALSRTMFSHANARAKDEFARENKIPKKRFTAVLDGRTTLICATLDGRVYDASEKIDTVAPEIPQHLGCRSTYMLFYEESDLASERKTLLNTKSQRVLNKEFRKKAKLNGTTPSIERRKWTKEVMGTVSGKTNFQQFFSKQNASFQKEYLGASRYKLYKKGKLPIDKMVDEVTGRPITLDKLKLKDAKAFALAGI